MLRKKMSPHPDNFSQQINDWAYMDGKIQDLEDYIVCIKRASNYLELDYAFCNFVDCTAELWSRIKLLKRSGDSQFKNWVESKEKEILHDPLLNYLRVARNYSQHNRFKIEWLGWQLKATEQWSGAVERIELYKDGTYFIKHERLSGTGEPELKWKASFPKLWDKSSKKRNKQVTPVSHFGRDTSNADPEEIATLGLEYYSKIVQSIKQPEFKSSN
jgi:hypothetical protein